MNDVATLIREGKIEQAESLLQQRVGGGQNAGWFYDQGRLMEAKGAWTEAMASYRKAVEMSPDHADALFRLAYLLDLHGREDEALPLYRKLAERSPTHVNALLNLTVVLEDQGYFEDALACVERVLAEHPNHVRALMFFKDILSSMNMFYDEDQERTRVKRNAILDTPITDFELSVRSRNCLKKMNIHTLGDLLKISEPELLAYKNFGETSLGEIKVMLSQKGLRLGQLKEEEHRAPRVAARRPAPDGAPEIANKYLSEIEFSSRSRKCLQRLNLLTLGDLMQKTEAELLATKNFGQTSLNEIKNKLTEMGLGLRRTD